VTQDTFCSDLRFSDCFRFRVEPGWESPLHGHGNCHEIAVPLRGEVQTAIAGQLIAAHFGEILLYPAGIPHAPAAAGSRPFDMLTLRWVGGEGLACFRQPCVLTDRQGRIRRQLDWLIDLTPPSGLADRRMADALTYSVIHELGRLQDPARSGLGEQMRRFIRAHIAERLTLEDLASQARLSKYHFARRFKKVTGQTPMGLVNQMRIEKARALILQTDFTLEAVARQVGLADASHLSHLFRRLTGAPPGALRH
jgi:AraC-like DNA-binding protein